jgi:purine nucleosidase
MAIALDPSISLEQSKHFVDVETNSELTRGMTVVDQLGVTEGEPNVEIVWEIDVEGWKEALYKTIRSE